MSTSTDERQTMLRTLSTRLANRKMLVTALTILVVELFQHLQLEVAVVWKAKWNFGKCAYLILRYLPIGFMGTWIYYNAAPESTSLHACQVPFSTAGALTTCACVCADAVLYLRVYSLSMKSKSMGIFLLANYMVAAAVCLAGTILYHSHLYFVPSPHFLRDVNCFDFDSSVSPHWLTAIVGSLLYSSVFTTAMSVWYGVKFYLSMFPIPPGFVLLKIFYIDGAFYFVSITAISTANILVALVAPDQYRHLLPIPQAIVHSVLASRMILHLREVARVSLMELNPSGIEGQHQLWGASLSLATFNAVPGGRDSEDATDES